MICHQNRRLIVDKFLYQFKGKLPGLLDTDLKVGPAPQIAPVQDIDGPETIGTIELRLFVLRAFSESHEIKDILSYDMAATPGEDDNPTRIAYKGIPQDYIMTFHKDCTPLARGKACSFQKKMEEKRPGKKPWMIFRFHYRSKGMPLRIPYATGNTNIQQSPLKA